MWIRMQSLIDSVIWKIFWAGRETTPWSTVLQADASRRTPTTGNGDFTVWAIKTCTQQPTTEERLRTGSRNTSNFQILASLCFLCFKNRKNNTAETSSSKCSPQLLLDHGVKKRVQVGNQQASVTSGKRLLGAQVLAPPPATCNKLGSCQIHNSHPGWMLNTINPRLDPTCREGNRSLWLNPNTWKHGHRYCPENCH